MDPVILHYLAIGVALLAGWIWLSDTGKRKGRPK